MQISMHNSRVLILTAAVACALSSAQSRAQSAGHLRRAAQPLEPQPRPSADSLFDIVIRNGRVLDGEGNPWILADDGIRDGKFAKIGKITSHAKKEIDATGK